MSQVSTRRRAAWLAELRPRSVLVALVAVVLLLGGCGSDASDAVRPGSGVAVEPSPIVAAAEPLTADAGNAGSTDTDSTATDSTATSQDSATAAPAEASPSPEPTPVVRVVAPNGRLAPAVGVTPGVLANQLIAATATLRDAAASPAERADAGHLHQVAIRKLGYTPAWDNEVFALLPAEVSTETSLHVSARRALIDLSSGYSAADFIPAWEIVEPEPAEWLLGYYQKAEEATGIDWEYLAAINLVETGMGRIRGLSSAGAQGPMQFLPTTWTEQGIGAGDINDPHDAIQGAARYLVRRGGPADMDGAIWGYNNSDDYVFAVKTYAELLRVNPQAYADIYNWEIYFFTEAGDVWLPTGFRSETSIDLVDFLAANPWSAPDAGLR